MKVKTVFSKSFASYGTVLDGYDVSDLVKALEQNTPCPKDATVYQPSEKTLEALPLMQQLTNNTKLNCLEYHRGSELNIPATDIILLLAKKSDVKNGMLNTKKVEAFFVPAGTVVQIYETTLHYAPCCAFEGTKANEGFRVAIVLPRDTNTEKPQLTAYNGEDKLLWAKNKWLIAHPVSNEAKQGAFVGLTGKNIDLQNE